ncbi:MAG: HAD family phosphatase [Patescibacteria group bacterium]
MLKGIIFDMDGTITLTERLHYDAYQKVLKPYGLSYSYEEQMKKYAGSGSKTIFSAVFAEHGKTISPQELDQCVARKHELYTKIVQDSKIEIVPGALEFIKKVHELGLKKIIATGNSNLPAVRMMLQKAGLESYFPEILSISEVARGKPFPDVFIEAARRIGCHHDECFVLEDAINGVTAAKAAGIRCIAFETSTPREELLKAGASLVVKNYFELPPQLTE